MLAASSYPTAAAGRPDLYRPSCTNQPTIVSQPYPTTSVPQTVFPSSAALPVEDIYNARAWYNPPQDMAPQPQTSPIDYQQQQQQQQRFDNRSPSCAGQSAATFRDAYKQYNYDCKY